MTHKNPVKQLLHDFGISVKGRVCIDAGASTGGFTDCLLKAGAPLSVSTDLFLEDVHFRRSYFTPEEIGHKALACNISDLAACGTRPKVFTLCLGLPPYIDAAWLEEFFSGMGSLAAKYGMGLAGGDISASDKLSIAVTVFGEPVGEVGIVAAQGLVGPIVDDLDATAAEHLHEFVLVNHAGVVVADSDFHKVMACLHTRTASSSGRHLSW